MPPTEHEFNTVLYYEPNVADGKVIAAVAWRGGELGISPAKDAPTDVLSRVRGRLGYPIEEAIEHLRGLGVVTPTSTVKAVGPTEAARAALSDVGLAR